ncbi:N-acetylmuramoyl-L-alanine amidase family protein [Novosphingobium decolorationis]|uniref:N-acetylmuramoyl-L-alanine amidase n=1 Tax=Novosphingobium decolorationis TaxID=2698673 RepID=A0ABX8DZX7_9SPHN|nr:N-acetylmuramoyl-L-alanine amidase [Novosphingobium decolorationis]MED5546491.1 N-acetylmuramoyl-L-alanine amidase [Pseudomonadota bacterium]QVM82434.1 N-acetylmuramoyl-L-alanine amidase [Novosphingobium decolorationis]
MVRLVQIFLLLLAPLALLACVFVINRTFAQASGGRDYVVRMKLPEIGEPADLPAVEGPRDARQPLVVIDAGHGGFDPGAGHGRVKEKQIALQIARAIRADLLAHGDIRVALTRDGDRFISLADRPDIARRLGADLFLSIHADSAESDLARGASAYVLSEKGSSEAARRFAASDAESDATSARRVNGVVLDAANDAVGAILLDLSQRGAQEASAQVASFLIEELSDADVRLHRRHVETAALAVLKAPDMPSVLFETGYINNAKDAAFLQSRAGQGVVAGAAARAIRRYFARRADFQ